MGKITVVAENCTGCKACMMVCTLVHEKAPSYKRSRVKVKKNDEYEEFLPLICRHCEEAPCVDVCPVGALWRDTRGAIVLNSSECTGCRQCVDVCPYGALFIDEELGTAYKCDLCNGEPACIKVCQVAGALRYEIEGGLDGNE
ncbi:4Fe-4S binding domain-containing protein [Thermanaeromonas toyohensis ToBE]|uniref:4Fe-4S binding domain-containing protein n=1 Tax=Thermanaeromonas toyohensis ToBE TaxID=698762 RepID=A0A1W1VPC6_9FIRM|nr:4Fe-4S binding domain-containing protein [Thermanaeromonas toyohensis ToBE]